MADQRIRCYLQTDTLFESIDASERTDAGKIEDRCIERDVRPLQLELVTRYVAFDIETPAIRTRAR